MPPGVAGASQSSVLLGLHGVRTPEARLVSHRTVQTRDGQECRSCCGSVGNRISAPGKTFGQRHLCEDIRVGVEFHVADIP